VKMPLHCVLVLIWSIPAAAAATPATAAPADSGLVLQVEVGSRLYPTWHELLRLRLGELFYLGDSEYTARIDRFLPDFRIIDGKFLTVSQELKNPAARVVVYHDTTAADTSWAFLNFPPHFSPRSFFTFQLKDIAGFVPASTDSFMPAPTDRFVPAPADSVPPVDEPQRPDSLRVGAPPEAPHE